MTFDEAAVERIVERAQLGEAHAFAELFDLYHRPVHRYIASRLHVVSEAEDLTQVVFLKAFEALPRYESRGVPFAGWLFRLARNTVIDFVRTSREHVALDALVERAGTEADPHEVVSEKADLDAVEAALATLTDEQREVIALRFFAGLSAREAAEAMGKQEGTIRGLQFRALGAIRRQLVRSGVLEEGEADDPDPVPAIRRDVPARTATAEGAGG